MFNRAFLRFIPQSARSACPWISSFVLLSLIGMGGMGAVASDRPTAHSGSGTQVAQGTADAIHKKLQGRWQIENIPEDGRDILIFTSDSKLYFVRDSPEDGKPEAAVVDYTIKSGTDPIQIEVSPLINAITLELTSDGRLRWRDRTQFSDGGIVFKKVSEDTRLPADVRMGDFLLWVREAKQSEAEVYLGAMIRGQQAFYLESSRFGKTVEDLQVGVVPETNHYLYRVVATGARGAVMTATAKDASLKSYTGIVIVDDADSYLTRGVICETNSPSQRPPSVPIGQVGPNFRCPAGSQALSE